MKLKKIFSCIISSVIFSVCVPLQSSADLNISENAENYTTQMNNDLSLQSTNSFGNLLKSQIDETENANNETEAEENFQYYISGINIEEGSALVGFNTQTDTTLVVGLYDEQTDEMVTSSSSVITPDMKNIELQFDVMPTDYFVARGYIVDTDTLAPLSYVYENIYYTKSEQEFYSITPDDFDSEKVLLFDENDTSDFAVFDDDTIVIEYSENFNTVTLCDDENGIYTIENPDEKVKSLSSGDNVALYYGDIMPIITKIETIVDNGDTVTITSADDIAIDEIFTFIRIDTGDCQPVYTEDVLFEGSEIITNPEDSPDLYSLDKIQNYSLKNADNNDNKWEFELQFDYSHDDNENVHIIKATDSVTIPIYEKNMSEFDNEPKNFNVIDASDNFDNYKEDNNGNLDLDMSISGSVKFSFTGTVKVSLNKNYNKKIYFELGLKSTVSPDFEIKGAFKGQIPLTKTSVTIDTKVPGVKVIIEPKIEIEANAYINLNLEMTSSIGFGYDGNRAEGDKVFGYKTSDLTKTELDIGGQFYLGLNINPKVVFINEKILSAAVEKFSAGVVLKGTLLNASASVTNEDGEISVDYTGKTERHLCKECIDGEVFVRFDIEIKIKILEAARFLRPVEIEDLPTFIINIPNVHLAYFYIVNTDENGNESDESGWKQKCPHREFLCTINLKNADDLKNIDNAEFYVVDSNNTVISGTVEPEKKTQVWLAPGKYTFNVSSNGYDIYSQKRTLAYESKKERGEDFNSESYKLRIYNGDESEWTQEISIIMKKIKYDVKVSVVDTDGNIINNAAVSCNYSLPLYQDSAEQIVLDAVNDVIQIANNASALFKLPDGNHIISATASGYETKYMNIDVNGNDMEITIELENINSDVPKIYEDILNMYYDYISTEWEDYPYLNCGMQGIRNSSPKEVSYLWYYYNKTSGLSEAGYQFIDINGDGIDELIVGINGMIYDLYTQYNGNVIHLAASGERDWFNIGSNYEVGEYGSGGAAMYGDTFYRIENGELKAYENYLYDGYSDPDNPYFYSDECELIVTEYSGYYNFTNYRHITEEEFQNNGKVYQSLQLTPFSEYKRADKDEESEISYKDILNVYYDYISTEWEDYPYLNYGIQGIRNSSPKEVSYLWYYYNKTSGLSEAGYQFIDINGDGIDELIVGVNGMLYDLYTQYNDKIIHIATSDVRDRFDIGSNYEVCESGSGGAAMYGDTFYRIENGELKAYENYLYDGYSDPDNPYFYSDECEMDEERGYYVFTNYRHITEEEFQNNGKISQPLQLTPFSEYKRADKDEESEISYNAIPVSEPVSILSGYAEEQDFTNLHKNTLYNVYAVRSREAEDILSESNLLYIAQTTSDENGNISSDIIKGSFENAEIFAVCLDGEASSVDDYDDEITELTVGETISLEIPEDSNVLITDPTVLKFDDDSTVTALSSGYAVIASVTDDNIQTLAVIHVKEVSNVLGDVNEDGFVNASDASLVLAEYAVLSTGGAGTFSNSQKSAGDVNSDGMIDASDASTILAFYAYISTGGAETDMSKWRLLQNND